MERLTMYKTPGGRMYHTKEGAAVAEFLEGVFGITTGGTTPLKTEQDQLVVENTLKVATHNPNTFHEHVEEYLQNAGKTPVDVYDDRPILQFLNDWDDIDEPSPLPGIGNRKSTPVEALLLYLSKTGADHIVRAYRAAVASEPASNPKNKTVYINKQNLANVINILKKLSDGKGKVIPGTTPGVILRNFFNGIGLTELAGVVGGWAYVISRA